MKVLFDTFISSLHHSFDTLSTWLEQRWLQAHSSCYCRGLMPSSKEKIVLSRLKMHIYIYIYICVCQGLPGQLDWFLQNVWILVLYTNTAWFCRNQSSWLGRPWQSPQGQGRKFWVKSLQDKTCFVILSLHDTILSPSCTMQCPGVSESLVFLCVCVCVCVCVYIYEMELGKTETEYT